jgi:glutamine synthetase
MPNGQPFPGDPRGVLQRVIADAEQMGLLINIGPELEFFLFKQADGAIMPLRPHDQASYFDVPNDDVARFWRQVVSTLTAFGITVEAMHHEVAIGQHEIDFRYSDALRTADNAVTFRVAVKTVAQRNGYYASFMPKPIRGSNGSGMHVHQSLMYKATNTNAFADPGDPHGVSKIAKHFIAGQLAHARGMCAIVAPLVNSYKRLVPGYEAPVYISWGRINRSALIRVPRAYSAEATRIELRSPDPSCNPYLAFTAMLAAGLDGIRRELPAPDATDENLYLRRAQDEQRADHLPTSLHEAVDEFEKDQVIRDALGPHIAERFINAKRLEWEDYRQDVSDWELNKYLPVH